MRKNDHNLEVSSIVISPTVSSDDRPKIEEFAVFGVMLGYDPDQVIVVLTEYFSLNPDNLTIKKNYSETEITSVHYSFDQDKVSVYFRDKDAEGKFTGLTSSIVFDGKSGSEHSDKLSATLSEFNPLSIAKESGDGNFKNTWCDTLNAAKTNCASKSGRMEFSRSNGRSKFGIGWY